ncbi:MAG: hypothetical protein V1674_01600 [Candidatus Omnitrophota bacterium]
MNKRLFLFVAILAIGLCFWSINSWAQEENLEYSFGTVVKVDKESSQLIVKEYAYDKDADIEVQYVLDPKVTLENIDSIDALVAQDIIELSYVTGRNNNRIAKSIRAFKPQKETPPLPVFQTEPAPINEATINQATTTETTKNETIPEEKSILEAPVEQTVPQAPISEQGQN